MILVADGGSTNASWCLINPNGELTYFQTEGYNPYFVDSAYMLKSLHESMPPQIERDKITEVHFYGAGCLAEKTIIVKNVLQSFFSNAKAQVNVDMLAAAKALLGDNPGFAAILGTGTNTCVYDGKEINNNVHSLGFILGDEGSGGHIGKKFLSDYIRENMPEDLSRAFWHIYHLTAEEIVDQIYTKPLANRFCADFCRFISDNIDNEYCYNLVESAFRDFFNNMVCRYAGYRNYSFNCIGSVGYNFKSILEEVAIEFNMPVGRIIQSPVEELVNYHVQRAPWLGQNKLA